jgi:hypothetical protein
MEQLYRKNERQQNGKNRKRQVTKGTKEEVVWRHPKKRWRIEEGTANWANNEKEEEEKEDLSLYFIIIRSLCFVEQTGGICIGNTISSGVPQECLFGPLLFNPNLQKYHDKSKNKLVPPYPTSTLHFGSRPRTGLYWFNNILLLFLAFPFKQLHYLVRPKLFPVFSVRPPRLPTLLAVLKKKE